LNIKSSNSNGAGCLLCVALHVESPGLDPKLCGRGGKKELLHRDFLKIHEFVLIFKFLFLKNKLEVIFYRWSLAKRSKRKNRK
jgi:hypothetical protein